MLAIVYLAITLWVGDALCRRFYRFVSVLHRLAAAFLVGLMATTWLTYLAARAFAGASRPLLWGNLVFFAAALGGFVWMRGRERAVATSRSVGIPDKEQVLETVEAEKLSALPADNTSARQVNDSHPPRPARSERVDWLIAGAYFVFAFWMMFATLNTSGNRLQIGNNQFSDFGPNTAIVQSFAVGHNFPTEYPHFTGDRIRYHFLFYFQAGNLEFLGLDPSWSINLLSILSLVSMLILVMVLGEVLFASRAVGRIGSALFFFFGSLSYIPYLRKQNSVGAAIHAIAGQREFLPSIFSYRGEDWGVWSLVVFLNQRHLAFAIAVVLLVLIFLVIRYREVPAKKVEQDAGSAVVSSAVETTEPTPKESSAVREAEGNEASASSAREGEPKAEAAESSPTAGDAQAHKAADETSALPATMDETAATAADTAAPPAALDRFKANLPGFVFPGVLLGLLPMWNSAVFAAAFALLLLLFILFPLRRQMLALAIATGVIALPQVFYLSTGSGRAPSPPLLHWGYTLDNPTIWNVVKYLGFTFGFKWLLIAVALIFATRLQRRIFVAASALILVAFLFQSSVEVLANHKFLHIWLIIANLFVAYGLWRLWRLPVWGTKAPGRIAAIVCLLLIIPGGIIDLFPIHNGYWTEVAYKNDRLIEWLAKETDPRSIFLTDRFVNHPILMAGRRVFYGWPYYAWSAGYRAGDRDTIYRQMLEERNPQALVKLLHDHNISYVAIDDGVRHGDFGKNLNEKTYRESFPTAFQDGSLTIFRVPETVAATVAVESAAVTATPASTAATVTPGGSMFFGGKGSGAGQFDWPRGIAADDKGNILVADTYNGRIQKFSSDGVFISSFGKPGSGAGEFKEPNGIAVDSSGNIYVADALNKRVQKLKPDGTFIAEWKGPEEGFAQPRDLSIGSDNLVYVLDEGRAQVIKCDRDGKILASWGSHGQGDGQFDQGTGVTVDGKTNRVYVADPRNRRIAVFDTNGKFIANWFVEEFRPIENAWYMQHLVVDPKAGRLYATSTQTDEILVFDLSGRKIGSLKPTEQLLGGSALVLVKGKLYIVNTFGARISRIDL